MSSPAMKTATTIPPTALVASATVAAAMTPKTAGKVGIFSHVKYEHMLAGMSGKISKRC